jgi:4-hydroxyproline epimerase
VAWGGNWFFLTGDHGIPLEPASLPRLLEAGTQVRRALARAGLAGEGGAPVDHVEFTGPARDPANHGRGFVLCPGLEWDRSPCGTGTSAKIACLWEDGRLEEGQVWRQESLVGSVFSAWMGRQDGLLVPHIQGRAFVTAEATLIMDPRDPFACGIPA